MARSSTSASTRRVHLSGWLLHDFQHVQDVEDGQASSVEIHPVTTIVVWYPNRKRWEDLR